MTPADDRMKARRGFKHARIWWLLSDSGGCPVANLLKEVRDEQKETYNRMLAILDHTDTKGPPHLPSQYKPLGKRLVEFKVSKPTLLRLYAIAINGGWLIIAGASSKNTQTKDIARARKRATEVMTRGCDFD